jgi:hypothetical protein
MGLRTPSYADVVFLSYRALLPSPVPRRGRPRAVEHELHVDAYAICPRCLQWIEPGDFVRRTAYGPHQHETC